MGNTATNVTTGKPNIAGAVYVAPMGTTLPTDATTGLDGAFVCLGYVSEDGLSNNNEMDVSAIKAWGGNIVLRALNELNDEFSLSLIETENADVLETVYGAGNVTVDGSGNVSVNVVAEDPTEMEWVFELALRGGRAKRIVIPSGAITTRDEITYNDSDAVAYGITISAYPDQYGVTHKEYLEAAPTTVTYTVTFDTDGGTAIPAQTVVAGGKATQPANPTKVGEVFQGWFEEDTFDTVFNFNDVITADTTVYAKFA